MPDDEPVTRDPGRSRFAKGPLVAFSHTGFTVLWLSTDLFAFAMSLEMVAVGWLILDETGSAFLTSVAFAVQVGPNIVFGPIAGALADRYPRSRVLAIASLLKALLMALAFGLVSLDSGAIAALLVLVAVSGISTTLRTTTFGAIIPDVVRQADALSATSLGNLAQRGVGVAGGLSAGFLIAWASPAAVFLLAIVVALLSGWGFLRMPSRQPEAAVKQSVWSEVRAGLGLLVSLPIVRALLGLMVVIEILGFSYLGQMPVLAEEALNVGPKGLGALTSANAAGGLIGMAALAFIGDYRRKGALLLGVGFSFGILLFFLGLSDIFLVSLLMVGGVGAAAAMVDTLEWVLLQSSVDRELRGRVMGAWSAAIGTGWVGTLALGLAAEVWGVQAALIAFGATLTLAAVVFAAMAPLLRRA